MFLHLTTTKVSQLQYISVLAYLRYDEMRFYFSYNVTNKHTICKSNAPIYRWLSPATNLVLFCCTPPLLLLLLINCLTVAFSLSPQCLHITISYFLTDISTKISPDPFMGYYPFCPFVSSVLLNHESSVHHHQSI